MNITITEHLNPPVSILQIEGRIHLGNASQLRDKAQEEYNRGARNIILDLSGVLSLTSEGLRSIHFIHNLFSNPSDAPSGSTKSSRVKLLRPNKDIQRTLNISGFNLFLDIFDDRLTALNSF